MPFLAAGNYGTKMVIIDIYLSGVRLLYFQQDHYFINQ